MKNEQDIPQEIIDWMAYKPFSSLSEQEQQLVTQYMDAAVYDELHVASLASGNIFAAEEDLHPTPQLKQKMDVAFREKHSKASPVLLRPVELWKVAAIFVLFCTAGLWYLHNDNASAQVVSATLVHDTIFVEKKAEQMVLHKTDTVVEYKYVHSKKKPLNIAPLATNDHYKNDTNMVRTDRDADIGIRTLQVEDLSKELPNKGKSMQEDGLVKRFGFAKI